MPDALRAVVLGVIEGLTEFLPISSTGHLLIAMPLLGVGHEDARWNVFLYVCQLGAILAVVAYFARDLWRRTTRLPRDAAGRIRWRDHLLVKLLVAMIPTGILGKLFDDFMEAHFEQGPYAPLFVAAGLIVGAAAIAWIDRRYRRDVPQNLDDVTLVQAFWIGLIQCLAMWPGTSRSGATIMGGMVLGLTPRVATEFSFYLAIPTMLAAGGWRLIKHGHELSADALGVVALGTGVSFVVALGVVAGFLRYVRRRRFTPFVIYRILLGLAIVGWYAAGGA